MDKGNPMKHSGARLSVSAAVVLLCCAANAKALDAQMVAVNIQPQPVLAALKQLGEQTGLQLLMRVDNLSIDGVTAQKVSGELTLRAALEQLLANTGLQYEVINDHTVRIVRPKAMPSTWHYGDGTQPLRVAQIWQGTATDAGSGGQGNSADSRGGALEEVVVTASKREERLIETPQSVSVLSAAAMTNMGATQFRDFADAVPGLNFKTLGAGVTQVSLRGVTTGFDIGPTVAIYIDDVPYGSSSAFADGSQRALDLALFDLDRVEVLRGPQGTLYGASAIGGLIKYVTQAPDASEFSGNARAGISSTREGGTSYNGVLSVNAPVVADRLALRMSGFYSVDGGYIDNLALGKHDVNSSDVYGGRLDLLFNASDAFRIRVSGLLQNISRDGEATANFSTSGVPLDGSLEQRRLLPEPFDQRFRLASATLDYNLGAATLSSISSYQTSRVDAYFDGSAVYTGFCFFQGDVCGAAGVPSGSDTDKFTQEVRLSSNGRSTIEWLVGGFYTDEDSLRNLAFDLRDTALQPLPNELYDLSAPSSYKEYAVFGNLTYHFSDRFDVTGGVRGAHNRQSYTQNASGAFIGPLPTHRSSEDVVTYLANARYHFSDRAIGYVRYATGYQPGGPNLVPRDPTSGAPIAPETFDAGHLSSYEVGFKTETANHLFGLDASAYYINWSSIQVQAAVNGFGYFANAPGGATVRGMELALTSRAGDSFTASAAFAFQDARMSNADPDLQAARHERLPGVPRFTAALNADYRLPFIEAMPLALGTTIRHVSNRNSSFDGSLTFPQYHLPEYTTVDLRGGFTLGRVDTQLYVHNLFDERGQVSAYTQFGPPRVAIVPTRTVGVLLTTKF
jgi:iron complex outermembrane receptor protein